MQCDVHWEEEMQLFLCPCHGGLYNRWGLNVGGPPPKPLPEYRHRIDADGVLYVRDQLLEEI
jgi:menaquinol-cytochrome c reductase iron-sulfur subunit